MQLLNDKNIRQNLIQKLDKQTVKPKAVIEELRVHNGNAIADVVAIYKDAHCFEIKGDGDKIERILEQGQFYNHVFKKITLVTTQKHLKKAIKISPKFWGIILAKSDGHKISLKYIRRATDNKGFNKKLALLTLWKSEMLSLVRPEKTNRQRQTRDDLSSHISSSCGKSLISQEISSLLFNRYQHLNT